MIIDHVDNKILKMIINGSQVTEIAEDRAWGAMEQPTDLREKCL
jgi:hypothetical protein